MSIGLPQILIVVLILILLFGRGKISDLMADFAKGLKSFRKGMAEETEDFDKLLNGENTKNNVQEDHYTNIKKSEKSDYKDKT